MFFSGGESTRVVVEQADSRSILTAILLAVRTSGAFSGATPARRALPPRTPSRSGAESLWRAHLNRAGALCGAGCDRARFLLRGAHPGARTVGSDSVYALDSICAGVYVLIATCQVEFTDQFGAWGDDLTNGEQDSIDVVVGLLERHGPALPHPHSSKIHRSKHSHMRELRVQHGGRPYRIFYAFDPRRAAILLVGGDKTGQDRFYEAMVAVADRLYDEHLAEIATGSG